MVIKFTLISRIKLFSFCFKVCCWFLYLHLCMNALIPLHSNPNFSTRQSCFFAGWFISCPQSGSRNFICSIIDTPRILQWILNLEMNVRGRLDLIVFLSHQCPFEEGDVLVLVWFLVYLIFFVFPNYQLLMKILTLFV